VQGWKASQNPYRPARTAAVLVAVIDQPDPQILLTVRSHQLNKHAGQVAFPGGAADANDPSGVRTALREAEEEIGLDPRHVQPLGFLDRIDTVSDFRVLPVVGLVQGQAQLRADTREVERIFTVPFEQVLHPDAFRATRIHRRGLTRVVYSLRWQEQKVWGVTAAILHNLAQRARQADRRASGMADEPVAPLGAGQ